MSSILNKKDLSILDYIAGNEKPVGPTEIGLFYNQPYNSASSWCSRSLQKLMDHGRITRFKGKYSIVKTT